MPCAQCKRPIPKLGAVTLNVDGDTACCEYCAIMYRKQQKKQQANSSDADFINQLCSGDLTLQAIMRDI